MRSLIEAALLDQARRVIATSGATLTGDARAATGDTRAACPICGSPLGSGNGAGRRNLSGYCSRTTKCRTAQERVKRQEKRAHARAAKLVAAARGGKGA